MSNTRRCLIAGLTGSGKTTYLAALSYLLDNSKAGQSLILGDKNVDKSYLYKLYDPWLVYREVDRTTQGTIASTTFDLIHPENPDKHLNLNLPDIAGEDYESLLHGDSSLKDNLKNIPDCMMFFIDSRNLSHHALIEDLPDIEVNSNDSNDNDPLQLEFTLNSISTDVKNVLLLKELQKMFNFQRVCFILSCWDKRSKEEIPEAVLRREAPFLYNFIKYHYPHSSIYGLSAQGAEYTGDEEQQEALYDKTQNGTRAYVKKEYALSYDITQPLLSLL